MATERLQRRIEQFLDEAEEAVARLDWAIVRDRAKAVLGLDQENADGPVLSAKHLRSRARNRLDSPLDCLRPQVIRAAALDQVLKPWIQTRYCRLMNHRSIRPAQAGRLRFARLDVLLSEQLPLGWCCSPGSLITTTWSGGVIWCGN